MTPQPGKGPLKIFSESLRAATNNSCFSCLGRVSSGFDLDYEIGVGGKSNMALGQCHASGRWTVIKLRNQVGKNSIGPGLKVSHRAPPRRSA